jgi:hypothetical protein|tara:strand:+ start:3482 stop:3748 length:267 start_codon:yes stop_codon:yes gene_type:complete
MKRLFTNFAKWLGFFNSKTVTTSTEKKVIKSNSTDIFKGRTKEWDSKIETKKKRLPNNANDIQKLDRKFNNSQSVYRDSKGRYASLKK